MIARLHQDSEQRRLCPAPCLGKGKQYASAACAQFVRLLRFCFRLSRPEPGCSLEML